MPKMYVELEPGDRIRIGSDTVIELEVKSGRRARLKIETEYKVDQMRAAKRPRPEASASSPFPHIQRPLVAGK